MDQSETPFLLFFAETNQRQSCSRVPQSSRSLSSSCAEVLWGRDWCWKGRKGLWPVGCNADRVEQSKFVVPFENTFLRRLRAQVHVNTSNYAPIFYRVMNISYNCRYQSVHFLHTLEQTKSSQWKSIKMSESPTRFRLWYWEKERN